MNAPALPENLAVVLAAARLRPDIDLSHAIAQALDAPEADLRAMLGSRYRFLLAEHLDLQLGDIRFDRISIADCREHRIVPFFVAGLGCVIATPDPWDEDLRQWLLNALDDQPFQLAWSRETAIQGWINGAIAGASRQVESGPMTTKSDDSTRTISIETIADSGSPVVRFVDGIVLDGWKAGASDIHFETGRDGLEVRLRLDGVLVPAGRFGSERPSEEIINRIKVLAQLDVSETRVPQDGRFRARLADRELDFRVSIMPSIFGEDAVIRLLDKAQLRSSDRRIDLQRLGFESDVMTRMRALAVLPHGMFLVTGPTGSGKTTTLYAVLSEIYTPSEKLITIEDPVEYELPGVLQIPVNEKKGLTFARGLRSVLRHDPDRILVGEIRDQETAEIAIQAALTGHLVFTTVHANNVFDVVGRFTHMGIDLYNFMAALNGVIAQRLIRLTCVACASDFEDVSINHRIYKALPNETAITLRRGGGCSQCRDTGYKGRSAVAEVLEIDETLREMVIRRESGLRLREYAAKRGLTTLVQRAYALVARGLTTIEEVDRVVGAAD